MVFVAPYRYEFDLGAHERAGELVTPGGGRWPRPYYGYFGVGPGDRGRPTAFGADVACSDDEFDRWSAVEADVLAEVVRINTALLDELDAIRAGLATPLSRRVRSAAMTEARRRSEQAVDHCYERMRSLAERYLPVWKEINRRQAPSPAWPLRRHAREQVPDPEHERAVGGGHEGGGPA